MTGESRTLCTVLASAKRAARKAPQKRTRAREVQNVDDAEEQEEAIEEAVEQEEAEQDAEVETIGRDEAGEEDRDKAGAERAPHEHEVVHERLIQEYQLKYNKRPTDAAWYNLLEKARFEVASKAVGKRRRIHGRLPDGVVPTWAAQF